MSDRRKIAAANVSPTTRCAAGSPMLLANLDQQRQESRRQRTGYDISDERWERKATRNALSASEAPKNRAITITFKAPAIFEAVVRHSR